MLTENEMPKQRSLKTRILLLEDDKELQELIQSYYAPRGYEIVAFDDPTVPLRDIQGAQEPNQVFDLVLTDLRMPNVDGMEFIQRMKKIAPKIPIILITAHSSLEIALQSVQEGAYDFVVKPLHFPQLNVSIERALHLRKLESENQVLRTAVKSNHTFAGAVGRSLAMKKVFDLARRVAGSSSTVLIQGESGTGKEVIARAIHQQSARREKPFIAINCSAIPEHLLEAELFGHSKGAFTGAVDKKIGLFEEADSGVLFLDEIGDLNQSLQAKLLRVLQERKIKRVGENVMRPIDVRILAATHKDLAVEVQEGRFREDLFFRLAVIPIRIPPLRERPEDIVPLAQHFLTRFKVENEAGANGISKAALDHLTRLPWRGNVRELENAIERAVVLCDSGEIEIKDLPQAPPPTPVELRPREDSANSGANALFNQITAKEALPSLDEYVLRYVELVLNRVGGVKEQAARVLGIDRKTLYRRIDDLKARAAVNTGQRPGLTTLRPPVLQEEEASAGNAG